MLLIQRFTFVGFILLILKGVDAKLTEEQVAETDKVMVDLFTAVEESLNDLKSGKVSAYNMDIFFIPPPPALSLLESLTPPEAEPAESEGAAAPAAAMEESVSKSAANLGHATLGNPVTVTWQEKSFRQVHMRVNHPKSGYETAIIVFKASKYDDLLLRLRKLSPDQQFLGFDDPENAKRFKLRARFGKLLEVEIAGKKSYEVFNIEDLFLPLIRKQKEQVEGWTAVEAEFMCVRVVLKDKLGKRVAEIPLRLRLSPTRCDYFSSGVAFVNVFKKLTFEGKPEPSSAKRSRHSKSEAKRSRHF